MTEVTCPNCGYSNSSTFNYCNQCHTPLGDNSPVAGGSDPQGIVLPDGYVLPPPPQPKLATAGVWRDKSILVMSRDAQLPNRCVKCNEPATGSRLKRKLSWHHPAYFLLILVAFLVYIIVAMIARKVATVEVGLCERHRAARSRNILITWSLVLLAIGGFVLAGVTNEMAYAALGLLLALVAIAFGIVTLKIVVPSRIDNTFVWLRGVNKDYLDQLPQWPGA